jgi:hypothetical protein
LAFHIPIWKLFLAAFKRAAFSIATLGCLARWAARLFTGCISTGIKTLTFTQKSVAKKAILAANYIGATTVDTFRL